MIEPDTIRLLRECDAGVKMGAASIGGATPSFSLQLVVISGILQWKYQLQVYVGA